MIIITGYKDTPGVMLKKIGGKSVMAYCRSPFIMCSDYTILFVAFNKDKFKKLYITVISEGDSFKKIEKFNDKNDVVYFDDNIKHIWTSDEWWQTKLYE